MQFLVCQSVFFFLKVSVPISWYRVRWKKLNNFENSWFNDNEQSGRYFCVSLLIRWGVDVENLKKLPKVEKEAGNRMWPMII